MNNTKTLYVSDLDGTLLASDGCMSEYTTRVLNDLIDQGVLFTPATARSPFSAGICLKPLHLSLPAILMNGGMEYDVDTGEVSHMVTLNADEAEGILNLARSFGLEPLIYAYDAQGRQRVYTDAIVNHRQRIFIETRMAAGDDRFVFSTDLDEAARRSIFYVTSIGEYDVLTRMKPSIEAMNLPHHLYEDVYLHIHLLEAAGRGATKAEAAMRLKHRLQAERLVAFGDNLNDIDMLMAADYAVAPANALDAVKDIADEVCSSCDEDGVAHWLTAHVTL